MKSKKNRAETIKKRGRRTKEEVGKIDEWKT
jgi:hypothetical protein